MIDKIKRLRCSSVLIAILMAASFGLCEPEIGLAQVTGSGTTGKIPKWSGATSLTDSAIAESSGNVGIGTSSPARRLEILGNSNPGLRITNSGAENGAFLLYLRNTTGAQSGKQFAIFDENQGIDRLVMDNSGNLGIGTTLPSAKLHVIGTATISGDVATGNINAIGNINATGVINAKYQDLAEWVPANRFISAGTVVVVDPDHSNHVLASFRAYDTRVAGVVSARPGVLLGEAGEGKVMVATTGRVKIKVDATAGPIRVGDLLVTSDKEGIAMKSQPLDLGGTPIHRPGTLIGKALEPLEKGVGEILALLSLQ